MLLSLSEPSGAPFWAQVVLSIGVGGLLGLAGGMVGLVLGNLRLPLVYYLLGSAPGAAGTNIGISAVAAAGATWRHLREGLVDRRVFLVMAPSAVLGAFAGGFFSDEVATGALLLIFAIAIVQGGVSALVQARSMMREGDAPAPTRRGAPLTRWRVAQEAAIGLVIGGLGGLVGLILGSLRLPAMLRVLNMEPRSAVGTNMAVGLVTGIAGVAGHLAGGEIDWPVLGLMGGASMVGSYYGARLTGRLSPPALLTALGVVLFAVAGAMFWQAAQEL